MRCSTNILKLIILLIRILKIICESNAHVVIHLNDTRLLEKIAAEYPVKVIKKIFTNEDFYHVKIIDQQDRILSRLQNDERINWISQQKFKERFTRSVIFNDPFYSEQWYLHNEGQTGSAIGNDLNVLGVWEAGFRGDGIVLSVLDDGLLPTHPDIARNYEAEVSYNVVELDAQNNDPTPPLTPDNSHGTYCAAIMASVANNGVCGVGIAHNAKIGGVRVMDKRVSDLQEAIALTYALDKVDIYSASWGPKDDGRRMSGPDKLAKTALKIGVNKGRGGKGAIYVWAAGNGGHHKDNCNMDGYVCSIYTVAIGALTSGGLSASYSEGCACILASAFVGGLHSFNNASALLKDSTNPKVIVPEFDGSCSENFQGTSAAAPQIAGVIALALQANNKLSWRDVQHLIINSARIPSSEDEGWMVNGADHHFHLKYGFGALDATVMVSKAQTWKSVGPQRQLLVVSQQTPRNLLCGGNATFSMMISDSGKIVSHLEHVIAIVDVTHDQRGKLSLLLKSPSGTVSQLLTPRPTDNSTRGIRKWEFGSVHFWDESAEGEWTFVVNDSSECKANNGRVNGRLNYFALRVFGSRRSKLRNKSLRHFQFRKVQRRAYYPEKKTLQMMKKSEKRISSLMKKKLKKSKTELKKERKS